MGDQFRWCEFGVLLLFFLLIFYFSVSRCIAEKRKRRGRSAVSPPLSRFSESFPSTPVDCGSLSWMPDRQNNSVFNVPEDRTHNRYGDIFFIEPGSEEANRIREQLDKDEKELPSYDEVMRMCNLTTPTAAAGTGTGVPQSPLGEPSPIGIAALPAPPYSETDPQMQPGASTVIAMEPVEPSTSRAAQIPPSSSAAPPPAFSTLAPLQPPSNLAV